MATRKTTAERLERLQRLVDKAARGRERLRQTFIEKHGIDLRKLKKLTPAEFRRELRAANADARQKEQQSERDDHHGGVDRLLRVGEVMKITGLKRTTLWKMTRENSFPKSVKLTPSGRAVGWRASEVARWVAGRYSDPHAKRGQ